MSDKKLQEILSVFEGKKGALISILQRVQDEYGYLPEAALEEIASFLKMPVSQVYSVATFYAHFYLYRRGDHLVRVCEGTACHVRGSRDIMETAKHCLGIKQGETTADYKFSLDRVACMGSCAMSPVVVLDEEVYGKMTPLKLKKLIEESKQERQTTEE
ncbi:MAG: NADH-quinone oxidoreductase subunit NuoE [Pseudomonadota bacterium]